MGIIKVNTLSSIDERNENVGDFNEQIIRCGRNTGNIVFFDLLDEELIFDQSIPLLEFVEINDADNIYVLPLSNWISVNTSAIKRFFLPLEQKDNKIVVVGLGIQLPEQSKASLNDFISQMDSDTKRALKIMSEHSVSIGVRGEITAECFEKLGIHNIDVVGCPSFYHDGMSLEGRAFKRLCDINQGNVCINITPGCLNNTNLLSLGMRNHYLYMLQTIREFPEYLRQRLLEQGKDRVVKVYFDSEDVNFDSVEKYIAEDGAVCWNLEQWRSVYQDRNISFTVGNRFHGNMMSYVMGIPSLWVKHDMRTKEMIDLFKFPYINQNEVEKFKDINQLKEKCIFDADFWKNRTIMFEKFIHFLNKNGLKHRFETKEKRGKCPE